MKKIIFIIATMALLISCKSQREECIKDLVDDKGYSYDDACDACDDMAADSARE
jgi:archaellum biogenesis protein FlaJ (TadC family)